MTSGRGQIALADILLFLKTSMQHDNEHVAYQSLTFCNTFDRFSLCVRPQLQDTFLPGIQGWPSDPFEAAQTKEHPDHSRSRCLCEGIDCRRKMGFVIDHFFHCRRRMVEHPLPNSGIWIL